jgi:aspartate aminotransferase
VLSDRLSNITPSYTIGISNKVAILKSQGENIINLSIGEPDFNVPNKAKEFGIRAFEENKTKYDLVPGLKILRESICNKLKKENNLSYDIDEIVVSSGAKHSITNALLALTNPGDDILIPKPYWVSYPEMVKLVGCNPVFMDTDKLLDFKVTKVDVEKYITPKTKLIFINNPSNPTGAVYSKKELEDIVDICFKNNIYILADEIYEKICYDEDFISIASISDKAKDITVTINGFSKSAAMTGLRLGYSASNKTIANAISTIQGHLVSHPSTITQYTAYGALEYCSDDIDNMVATYKHRRNLIANKLSTIPQLSFIYPKGAFYLFIDISYLRDKIDYKESLSIEFCNKLLDEYKVAVVPGIAFGMDDYVRISYACSEDDFLFGIEKIKNLLSSCH